MIYLLVDWLRPTLEDHAWLGWLRLFGFIEFRAVLAILLGFVLVVAFGPTTIRQLVRLKIGDNPDFGHKSLNELMKGKSNTPTMGGILICGAIFVVTLLLADITSFYVQMGLVCLVCFFGIGVADDYMKLTAVKGGGGRQGLYSHEKMLLVVGISVVLGIFIYSYGGTKFTMEQPGILEMSQSLNLPFLRTWKWDGEIEQFVPAMENLIVLPQWLFVLLAVLVIAGSSNAVNLTDGMDGLAGGVTVIVSFAMMVLCIIVGYESGGFTLARELLMPYIPQSDELAVVAGAMVGACVGFLWFNCHPAQVFMGDSGSLPLGALLGYIAVVTRQEALLAIIGGVFVAEALSVVIQVVYFKATGGKRVFLCAPIHHHFHLGGWNEQQVVIRFWLITIVLAAMALATVKIR